MLGEIMGTKLAENSGDDRNGDDQAPRPCIEMAQRYLRLLAGGDVPHTFQPYHDQDPKSPRTGWMRRRVHGQLIDVWPTLIDCQSKGAAIAVTIAETDGRAAKRLTCFARAPCGSKPMTSCRAHCLYRRP
jgi:hypothetical protein